MRRRTEVISRWLGASRAMARYFLLLCALAVSGAVGHVCRNEYGEPVDWFLAYKLPKIQQGDSFFVRKGLGYVFLTSKYDKMDWREGIRSAGDVESIMGASLAPLYNKTESKKLFHVLYNDDPPLSAVTLTYGHTKGAVISDGEKGLWMVHSAPRFPIQPVTTVNGTETWNKYEYPESATKFGQSFLCISLNKTYLDVVGLALMYNKPKIYSSNVPSGMEESFPNLALAATGKYVKQEPWYLKTVLLTLNGTKFKVFAKTKYFDKDLYADLIAPDIRSNMEVETWMNGPGDIDSDCKRNYSVVNVLSVGIKMSKTLTYNFKSSQDHSKWAISEKSKGYVCVGDINRMKTQLKRGGGSVCFRHPQIWKRYGQSVTSLEPCPIKPRRHFNFPKMSEVPGNDVPKHGNTSASAEEEREQNPPATETNLS